MKAYAVFYGPVIAGVPNTYGKFAIYDTKEKCENRANELRETKHYIPRIALVEIKEIKELN